MRKLAKTSMFYMIAGLVFGVYFREFTKFYQFTAWTQLRVLHTHALILGMFFFLIVLILEKNFKISEHKNYRKFYAFYNAGLGITMLMMLIHGTLTVLGVAYPGTLTDISNSAAISGIAGLGHIIMTVGLGFFFQCLLGSIKKTESK